MKLSVSLPDEDVEFLDEYAKTVGAPSRSAVIQRAVGLLRATRLGSDYADAWVEWSSGDEAALWESVTSDGLRPSDEPHAPR
jgi:Arc/MetJ-type ribon-helix-helix transcriptional regulator